MKTPKEKDIILVREFMLLFHKGYASRAPRADIILKLDMDDRYFRNVCSDIPEILATTEGGYYILPDNDPTGFEAKKAQEIINGEDQRRLVSLYLRQRARRRAVQTLVNQHEPDLFKVSA